MELLCEPAEFSGPFLSKTLGNHIQRRTLASPWCFH
jgi:hypothetical protein